MVGWSRHVVTFTVHCPKQQEQGPKEKQLLCTFILYSVFSAAIFLLCHVTSRYHDTVTATCRICDILVQGCRDVIFPTSDVTFLFFFSRLFRIVNFDDCYSTLCPCVFCGIYMCSVCAGLCRLVTCFSGMWLRACACHASLCRMVSVCTGDVIVTSSCVAE